MLEIKADNYSLYAYTNAHELRRFRAVVLNFHGLNKAIDMADASGNLCAFCTQREILYVFPYLNPWNWMNSGAVRTTDRILDALWQAHSLPEDLPICVAGRSMGGQGALIYALRGKYRPVACALNCPVCDLSFHCSEREDVPRTIYSAFCGEDAPLEDAIRWADPLFHAASLPRIPYYIAHCEQDTKVSKQHHSDRLVQQLRRCGQDVTYRSVPGRDHIDLPDDVYQDLFAFIGHCILS